MPNHQTDAADFIITIEYDGFLTRFDINEIIEAVDSMIATMLFYPGPDFGVIPRSRSSLGWWYSWTEQPAPLSFVGIRSIEPGSLTLLVFVSGAVVSYVAHRFAKGVDGSLLGKELERSGQLFGNMLAH